MINLKDELLLNIAKQISETNWNIYRESVDNCNLCVSAYNCKFHEIDYDKNTEFDLLIVKYLDMKVCEKE